MIIFLLACQTSQQNSSEATLADTAQQNDEANGRWSEQKAQAWYAEQLWLVGANFMPSNAINQLEIQKRGLHHQGRPAINKILQLITLSIQVNIVCLMIMQKTSYGNTKMALSRFLLFSIQ